MIPPQIWRLATNFLLAGPKLGMVLDPYFLFSYLRQLEVGSAKFSRKEDVVWYLVTVSGIILVGLVGPIHSCTFVVLRLRPPPPKKKKLRLRHRRHLLYLPG